MKKTLLFIVTLLFAVTSASRAQNPVVDKYPAATIYIIDPQSGQEVLAQNDDAVLFKDAFIDLVNNTNRVKYIVKSPGHKTIVITQSDPADGNAFQITSQSKFLGQEITNYTFSYSVDQNTLYYLDPNSQTWQPELVQGYNVVNLNNCLAYGKFNELQVADAGGNNDVQQTADDGSDDGVTADTPPPALQDYDQPECPQDDYLWQPGYWAYNPGGGYYWVAGTWVAPPSNGLLWTPPYWGYEGARYVFHAGYWGPEVGFYGGINYGYGYGGDGYYGGNWYGGHFRYNTAVVRVNSRMRNVYVDRSVVRVGIRANVSFNGPGGARNRPTERELKVANENHIRDNHQNPRAANAGNNHQNAPGGNNGGRSGNAYTPRNGNAQGGNNGGRNDNGNNPRNGNAPGNNGQNAYTPRNGSGTNTAAGNAQGGVKGPGNGPGRQGNVQGGAPRGPGNGSAPRGPGSGPAVPKGPGHNNNGTGGNYAPRNGNGGQNKTGGKDKGSNKSSKPANKDDKKGN